MLFAVGVPLARADRDHADGLVAGRDRHPEVRVGAVDLERCTDGVGLLGRPDPDRLAGFQDPRREHVVEDDPLEVVLAHAPESQYRNLAFPISGSSMAIDSPSASSASAARRPTASMIDGKSSCRARAWPTSFTIASSATRWCTSADARALLKAEATCWPTKVSTRTSSSV